MQQVFFKKHKYSFVLLEVFIALLLFSIIIAPFLVSPFKTLKKDRDYLIKNELQRYNNIYISKILKKEKTYDEVDPNKIYKLDTFNLDIHPIGIYTYTPYYKLKINHGKKSNTSLVTITLFFKPATKYLPKINPYKYMFTIKNKQARQHNQKQ